MSLLASVYNAFLKPVALCYSILSKTEGYQGRSLKKCHICMDKCVYITQVKYLWDLR